MPLSEVILATKMIGLIRTATNTCFFFLRKNKLEGVRVAGISWGSRRSVASTIGEGLLEEVLLW